MQPSKEVCELLMYFHERCLTSVTAYKQKILDRIQITQFIRKLLLDVQRTVYARIKEIEEEKLKKL